ncbi:unnamed protein product [Sphagnum jensenii]|uniref:Uncharacterized protein n=1 Tax=Sphagnum jensenii TaxID=128206 RepID=A0ABP1AFA8_9BRYO
MSTHSSSKSSRPRIPIPNNYDPITRQLKYVDKAHRLCVPNHIAASFTPHDNYLKYHMRTHTSIKTMKLRSGHLVAIPHPQVLSGYKAPRTHEQRHLFSDLTTKRHFEKMVHTVGMEIDSFHKRLCPFRLTALRNYVPWSLMAQNVIGTRAFDERNASYIRLESRYRPHTKTPLTTNQRYMRIVKNSESMQSNPTIFAEKSKMLHKFQLGDMD